MGCGTMSFSRLMMMLLALVCGQMCVLAMFSVWAIQPSTQTSMERLKNYYLEKDCKHTDPEVCMNVSQLITYKGYPCEDHVVQTQDGFLLSVQHISYGRHNAHRARAARPVIFLQHGLLSSSADWVMNLANESLAFILADAGFDVWLGNIRGNTYSNKHIKYKPSDKEFWAWSLDEMARYDLPAMVDYVLEKTGQSQLYYGGHSQGTTIGFAEFSRNETLADKIKTFFAFAPVATVGHIEGPLRYISYFSKDIQALFNIFGVYDFLPNSAIMKFLASTFCHSSIKIVCEDIIFLIAGFDTHQMNETRLPVYISHTPAGTSVQNMVHFGQMVRSGEFSMYDYGSKKGNFQHYNQTSPPLYHPKDMKVPVMLFSGGKDWLADPTDVKALVPQLSNIVGQEYYPTYNHMDFVWGVDVATTIYQKVVDHINNTTMST